MTDPIDALHALPRYAGTNDESYKPGLDRMHALCEALAIPVADLPTLHIAGTNGKGSTAAMSAAIAQAAGYRVGLHTSPHLWSVAERMCVDGTPIPEDTLRAMIADAQPAFERIEPSFFEATVALSLQYFAREAVDLAVVEVGLGGRLDATNVVAAEVAVITSIALEHTALLGDTEAKIAQEKGGIMRTGQPVVLGPLSNEAGSALHKQASACGAVLHRTAVTTRWNEARRTLITPRACYTVPGLDLPGGHQKQNAACAVRALELHPAVSLPPDAVASGLGAVRAYAGLHGRMERLATHPPIWIDVAHNPAGLAAACEALPRCPGHCIVALGVMRDKPLGGLLDVLADRGIDTVWPVEVSTDRALPAQALADACHDRGWTTRSPSSLTDHVDHFQQTASPEDLMLVTGSHYTVGALPETLRPL